MATEHLAGCRYEERKAAREAWLARWPNHCAACLGAGSWSETYDPSPAGVSLGAGTLTDGGPCECAESGCCPRCGVRAFVSGEAKYDDEVVDFDPANACPACGWNHGKGPDDVCPPEPECFCQEIKWEKEAEEYERAAAARETDEDFKYGPVDRD